MTVTGCSCLRATLNISHETHNSCSPDIQITKGGITCGQLSGGDIQCTITGTVENKGTDTTNNIQVLVEWAAEHDFVYWNPSPIGTLQPGQKADFEARFNGYEFPNRYDIYTM